MFRETKPAVGFLTQYVRFSGFPLCVKRIEFLLKSLFNGFAGIDSASFLTIAGIISPQRIFSRSNEFL